MLTIVADVDVEVSINSRVKIPNLQLTTSFKSMSTLLFKTKR